MDTFRCIEAFVRVAESRNSTRTVMLSEAGSYFLTECLELVSHLDSVVDSMRAMKATPTGVLRLQVLPGFALGHLGSALKDFSSTYPGIDLDISLRDHLSGIS